MLSRSQRNPRTCFNIIIENTLVKWTAKYFIRVKRERHEFKYH